MSEFGITCLAVGVAAVLSVASPAAAEDFPATPARQARLRPHQIEESPEKTAVAANSEMTYEGDTEMTRREERDGRIEYIEFLTTDLAATKTFYSAVFGWTFTDFGPDYASFEDGSLTGGFATAETVQTGGPLVVIYAVDLAAIESRVKEHGGSIVRETFSFPGGRRFHFTDPSGNLLAVWSE